MGILARKGIGRPVSISVIAVVLLSFWALHGFAVGDDEPSKAVEKELEEVSPKDLKNPVPFSRESVKRGRNVYLRNCQDCHDHDGKSMTNVEAQATDLTLPKFWKFGTSDGEVFVTLRDGVGDNMPPFGQVIKDEKRIWYIVNFLRSIGPKDKRPAYVDEKSIGSKIEP